MLPGVFGDKFCEYPYIFGDQFSDEFSEPPNFMLIRSVHGIGHRRSFTWSVLAKLGETNSVFRLGDGRLIGSMKENTRAFYNNEYLYFSTRCTVTTFGLTQQLKADKILS